jgi:hypothetical protein
MILRLKAVIAGVVALSVAALPAGQAHGASPAGQLGFHSLSTDERGCTEIAYLRGGSETAVRPLVPERFALEPFPAPGVPRVTLLVNELTCQQAAIDGPGRPRDAVPVTNIIVSALVTGPGAESGAAYILFIATDNPVEHAALRALGWPADLLNKKTYTDLSTDPDGLLTMNLHVIDDRWAHAVTAQAGAALDEPSASTAAYIRDTRWGLASLCYANEAAVVPATVTGDLRPTPLASVTYFPPLLAPASGFLVVGDWQSELILGSCPA